MIEQDTIKLLRECDAGIKMGIASIDDVTAHVESDKLSSLLNSCRREHEQLQCQIQTMLGRFQDQGKNPNIMARSMSKMKTGMKLGLNDTDQTVASLMTDGCNMGVKSLNRYLNQYEAADERSKDITKRLIHLEAQLAVDMRPYL